MRRSRVRWLAAPSAVLLTLLTTGARPRPDNIVVVSIDTLRVLPTDLSPFPTLERLTSRAVRFTNAYSTASWTLPAHGSLLTGLYPDRHGATSRHYRMAKGIATLASVLHEAGLETIAFTGGGFVDKRFGFAVGFDRYDDWVRRPNRRPTLDLPRRGKRPEAAGAQLFDRALAYLDQRSRGDPHFFLFLHTYAVHNYYLYRHHPWVFPHVRGQRLAPVKHYTACVTGKRSCGEPEWQALEALYRAELSNLDAGLGRLLTDLEDRDLSDSTLLILLSDHGEGFDWVRGRIHHGGRLHQDVIRIPLLIAGPGLVPKTVQAPISLVDVMPTVLDLAGLPVPQHLDGASMVTLLGDGTSRKPRLLYAMEHVYRWRDGARVEAPMPNRRAVSLAVIEGDTWYIQGPGGTELYDMANDPDQRTNLAGVTPSTKRMRTFASRRNRRPPPRSAHELDPALARELRSLGYIQ